MTTIPRLVSRGCDQELRWNREGIAHQCTPLARMRARQARLSLQRKLDQVAEDIRTMRKEVAR
jgi:hypothetical protein